MTVCVTQSSTAPVIRLAANTRTRHRAHGERHDPDGRRVCLELLVHARPRLRRGRWREAHRHWRERPAMPGPQPAPRVDKHANAGAVTPYQQFLTLITGASHGVARLMLERDIDPEEKLAPSLRLSTVKTCLQHAGFWEGHRLPDDWPALPDSLQGARVLPDRESNLPRPSIRSRPRCKENLRSLCAVARRRRHAGEAGGDHAAALRRQRVAREARQGICRCDPQPAEPGGRTATLCLGPARQRISCFARMRNPLRDGYRLLMDGDDADFCNPALYEDERATWPR